MDGAAGRAIHNKHDVRRVGFVGTCMNPRDELGEFRAGGETVLRLDLNRRMTIAELETGVVSWSERLAGNA